MKKNYSLVFVAMLLLFSFSVSAQPWMKASILSTNSEQTDHKKNFHDIQKIFYDYWKDKIPSEGEEESGEDWGYQQFKRWEWFMEPRTYPTGDFFDPEILFKEYQKEKSVQQRLSVHPAITAANWSFIGPNVVPSGGGGIGRINVVRFDPVNTNIIYAGSANGGLWKSTTGGGGWTTSTDFLPALGVADIAVNPRYHDSLFIATGDRDGYENGIDFWGGTYSAGVLVSPDGGQTWNPTGLSYVQTNSNVVHRLQINPVDPNIILAATRTGIYRTVNAGVNWTLAVSGNFFDMEFRAGSTDTLYAVNASSLYMSTNRGLTWTVRAGSLGGGGGIVLAVTAANPNVLYTYNGSLVVKKSINGGLSFTTMTSVTSLITSQGFYNCTIGVSPTDANVVFCGGAQKAVAANNLSGMVKSTDGGVTWSLTATTVHCDHHEIEFLPGNGSTLIITNDGGIFKSTNAGTSWTDISSGIAVKQYYRIAASALTPGLVYGGAQDNGTDQLKNNAWRHVLSGDGMDCVTDYTTDNVAYVSLQYGKFYKTTNGGNSFALMTLPGTGGWTSPMVIDPIDHNTLYCGLVNNLYKSTNAGGSWTAISTGQFGSQISCIAVYPIDVNYIYASTLNKICRTTDGGVSWTNITPGLPLTSSGITWVTVSSLDPLKIWVTLTGYAAGNKVFYSVNGGNTWTNISGSLPNIPANCITYQNNSQDAVYVGTDFGVYYRDATMTDWISYNTGLPNVIVDELEIQYGTINKIRAATYGRSIWESDLNSSSAFSLDAGMMNILSPSSIQLCDSTFSPAVTIRNFGQTTIDSLNINYQVDAGPVQVYQYTGSLATGTNATVTLPTLSASQGTHAFTVFTSDPNGSLDLNSFNDSRTTTFDIDISLLPVPIKQGFDTTIYPPATWTINDPNSLLQRFATAGGFGNSTSSLKARAYAVTAYANLNSSRIDFSNLLAPASLTFSLAYVQRNASSNDSLKVQVSTDCGISYTTVYSKTGAALATGPMNGANFTPTVSSWRSELVDLTSYIGQQRLQVRFVFYGNHGNNIYVDDINILDRTSGVNEATYNDFVSVYPNPTNGQVIFNINYPTMEKVTVEIFDVLGNLIQKLTSLNTTKENNLIADLREQAPGIYFYRITSGTSHVNKGKLVKM